jgi:hypothetical protein
MIRCFALICALVASQGGLPAAPAPPAPKVPPELARERLDSARKAYEGVWLRLRNVHNVSPETIYLWSRRWMEAQQALDGNKDAERATIQSHLDRMKELERSFATAVRAGQASQVDADAARYYRAEAAIWLSQVKGK